MRLPVIPLLLAWGLVNSSPAHAQSEVENGFQYALKGCANWVLHPATWIDGPARFASAVGLEGKMFLVQNVEEFALPPDELRVANHYWRINAAEDAGFFLVVSDAIPMCHITGGGALDLQPVVQTVLASDDFQKAWILVDENEVGDMISSQFQNREDNKLSITISRAKAPGGRQDRVQVLATALFDMGR